MNLPPEAPSDLKHTNHILREISQLSIPTNALEVTMDVASLHMNIPHQDGVNTVISAYNKIQHNDGDNDNVLATLSRVVLENDFEFEEEHYLKVRATAMSARMAANYANLFMADLESRFLSHCELKLLSYKR